MSITISIFPKFLAHLTVSELAAAVREAGLDTTNLVVRDGFWVSRSNFADDLPKFMNEMRDEGLDVRFATMPFSADELLADPSPLARLAEQGIRELRIDYFRCTSDPRRDFASARRSLESLVPLCQSHRIRAVYQVHHRMLISSAWSAWDLVRGLPPDAIGIELDPGNQSFEGFESWDKSIRLLSEHFVAAGIKDTRIWRDESATTAPTTEPDKGWRRAWCPIDEGVTNWHDFAHACIAANFTGTLVFMPFYDPQDPAAQLRTLRREVAYLRDILDKQNSGSSHAQLHDRTA